MTARALPSPSERHGTKMVRPRLKPDLSNFSGCVSARLRHLRLKRGWTMQDFRDRLCEAGASYRCTRCRSTHIGLRVDKDAFICCSRQHCGARCAVGKLKVAISTLWKYEVGKDRGGADLPLDYFPIVAAVYGAKGPVGWMPNRFPLDVNPWDFTG